MKKQFALAAVAALGISGAAVGMHQASATPTTVGSCSGLVSVAKITPSLSNVNQSVTTSGKGGATGSCSFSAPASGGGSVTKWGYKLTSPVADCIGDTDPSEYPQSGKVSVAFAATKLDGYVRSERGVAGGLDLVGLVGIVTKGDAVGMTIGGTLYMDPIIKIKGATDVPGLPDYAWDIGNAGGCQDPTGATPANLTGLLIGDGTSPLLSSPAGGIEFSYGL